MKYSLAKYILSVQSNDESLSSLFQNVSIGGEGSATESISIKMEQSLYSTSSYATGAWVHDKNLAKNGTVDVSISQLSEKVAKFKQMCNVFFAGEYEGFTLTLSDTEGVKICTCIDCYLTQIPNQEFKEKADNQTWTFTCGEIIFD